VNLRRWLTPGIGVKRWLLVAFAGLLVLALGVAHVLRQVTKDLEPGGPLQVVIDALTLRALPLELRGIVVIAAGVALASLGAYRAVRALLAPFEPWDRDQPLVEVIYQKRFLARGPRIVAIGGGTGLSTLLRGLKEHTSNLTAVVTVADDGGSSGKLREQLGIPAVGDIRNCIVALADAEPLMARLLQYRFPAVDDSGPRAGDTGATGQAGVVDAPDAGLAGHALGNLLLAAMCAVEDGDFEEAVREMNRVLAVRGQVVPATATPLVLKARLADGSELEGQSVITRTAGVERVWISPADVHAAEDAVHAIAEADLVVLGPGSLFTSVLPALLVPGIREALAITGAQRVYVCNVATQAGETSGFDLADHVAALERHLGTDAIDLVLANNRFDAQPPASWQGEAVRLRWPPPRSGARRVVLEDIVDPDNAHHHDPVRLAAALLRVWERGGRRRVGAVRSA